MASLILSRLEEVSHNWPLIKQLLCRQRFRYDGIDRLILKTSTEILFVVAQPNTRYIFDPIMISNFILYLITFRRGLNLGRLNIIIILLKTKIKTKLRFTFKYLTKILLFTVRGPLLDSCKESIVSLHIPKTMSCFHYIFIAQLDGSLPELIFFRTA